MSAAKEKVAIIGSGNWGSAIAKIIGANVARYPDEFDEEVKMWMYEEEFHGEKLSHLFNTYNQNKKYLPGIIIPKNVRAVTCIKDAAHDATVLVFVLPHQFLLSTCNQIKPHLNKNAEVKAISLIKGIDIHESGPVLLSNIISNTLNIDASVLMGANIATEVAKEEFSEATIGYSNLKNGLLFERLFHTSYFNISIIDDVPGVEMCGALKNVVALGAGFSDGLGYRGNTKSAIIRIGLMEMRRFTLLFFPNAKMDTFFESCGISDLFVTCTEGRNRKCADAFVRTGKSFSTLEKELLGGQKLQGTLTVKEVYSILVAKNLTSDFPLFTAIYKIVYEGMNPREMVKHVSAKVTSKL